MQLVGGVCFRLQFCHLIIIIIEMCHIQLSSHQDALTFADVGLLSLFYFFFLILLIFCHCSFPSSSSSSRRRKMSDEEDAAPAVKKSRVFYGSLEEKERERLSSELASGMATGSDAVKVGIEAGNINISSGRSTSVKISGMWKGVSSLSETQFPMVLCRRDSGDGRASQ